MGKLRLSSVRVAVQSDPESDEGAAASPSHSRKRQRMMLRKTMSGTSQKAYRFSKNLDTSSSVADNSEAKTTGSLWYMLTWTVSSD